MQTFGIVSFVNIVNISSEFVIYTDFLLFSRIRIGIYAIGKIPTKTVNTGSESFTKWLVTA